MKVKMSERKYISLCKRFFQRFANWIYLPKPDLNHITDHIQITHHIYGIIVLLISSHVVSLKFRDATYPHCRGDFDFCSMTISLFEYDTIMICECYS
jgi:hypothetical protein